MKTYDQEHDEAFETTPRSLYTNVVAKVRLFDSEHTKLVNSRNSSTTFDNKQSLSFPTSQTEINDAKVPAAALISPSSGINVAS